MTYKNYDQNTGIISGIVIRVDNKSTASTSIAEVTLGGLTMRVSASGQAQLIPFFEEVKCFGKTADAALQLKPGTAVLFNNAYIEQEVWEAKLEHGGTQTRKKLIVRGLSFSRLQVSSEAIEHKNGFQLLRGAVNEFHVSGRLIYDATTKTTEYGQVTELAIASTRTTSAGEKTYIIDVECWADTNAALGKKGSTVMVSMMLMTRKKKIDGETRKFTTGQSRSVSVTA